MEMAQKTKNIQSRNSIGGHVSKGNDIINQKDICPLKFIAVLITVGKICNQPRCQQ